VTADATVYAVRLDRGGELDDEETPLVEDAVGRLRNVVASAVDSLEHSSVRPPEGESRAGPRDASR
jgi:hypothetical protein